MSFTPLGDALNQRLSLKISLKKQLETAKVIEIAKAVFLELFSPELAQHAVPLFLKNRTLTVSCTSSAMAAEIRLRQGEIVKKMNAGLGETLVDRIRYLA